MNTKKIGAELENFIVAKLKEIESHCRLTKGSGNKNEKGDIRSEIFQIECKKRNLKDFTIKEDVWDKLLGENQSGQKIPILFIENKNKNRLAVLDVEDFFRLIKEWHENKEMIDREYNKFEMF